MTFDQIFSGRLLLCRATRHVMQAHFVGFDHSIPVFRTPEGDAAFWLIESKLRDLENEFEAKKKRCARRKQLRLYRRADAQVRRAYR